MGTKVGPFEVWGDRGWNGVFLAGTKAKLLPTPPVPLTKPEAINLAQWLEPLADWTRPVAELEQDRELSATVTAKSRELWDAYCAQSSP